MTAIEIGIQDFNSHSTRKTLALIIWLVSALFLLFSTSLCLAQNDLVRFLPPDAPVLAGLHRMPADQAKDALWLATRNNIDDINRLVALTASDLDRRIDQVIVADWRSSQGNLGSHLLVAQGRFNFASITSTIAHPTKLTYRGVPVLAIQAKGGSTPVTRWLAVPEHDTSLFGTPSAVQLAIDRYVSGASADPQLLQRLKDAHAHDAAWSSIVVAADDVHSRLNLPAHGDRQASCLAALSEIDLGIQLGKTVTIDLRAERSDGASQASAECVRDALFGSHTPQMRVTLGGEQDSPVRVTMARAAYDGWLDSFRKSHLPETLTAMISGSEPALERNTGNLETLR
jgi:hypothetical protein